MEKYCRAGQDTDANTIWRMRIGCRMTKATDRNSDYVILLSFPLQQWLHERGSMLCYTYIACLVVSGFDRHAQKVAEHGIDRLRLFSSVFINFLLILYRNTLRSQSSAADIATRLRLDGPRFDSRYG